MFGLRFCLLAWTSSFPNALAGETSDEGCLNNSPSHLLLVSFKLFIAVCGRAMSPQVGQNVKSDYDARYVTSDFQSCKYILAFNPGVYRRDRLVDYDLGCKVDLLRVHVRNSNRNCQGNSRCALKNFELMGSVDDHTSWNYIGRFTMPDPGLTVSV